jgi:hypothetical protein
LSFSLASLADSFGALARTVAEIEAPGSLLLKPHPRNSQEQVEAIVERVAKAVPDVPRFVMRRHSELPIEILLGEFSIASCAALGSSSLRTLKRIYGTRSYCGEQALLALHSSEPETTLRKIRVWVEDHRSEYRAV